MSINEIKDFKICSKLTIKILEWYHWIGFSKESSYYSVKHLKKKTNLLLFANKLIEKIPDPHNAEEHHQSFLRKKKRKPVKRSEIIPYRPKTLNYPRL